MAGIIVSLSSSIHTENGIVHLGAIHYITSILDLLSDVRCIDNPVNNKVKLPNGDSKYITHVGNSSLSEDGKLKMCSMSLTLSLTCCQSQTD